VYISDVAQSVLVLSICTASIFAEFPQARLVGTKDPGYSPYVDMPLMME